MSWRWNTLLPKYSVVPWIVSRNITSQYHSSICTSGTFSPMRSGKMNVACLLMLLGVSPQLQCSLLTPPQLELSASFPFLVESSRCLLNCHCTRYGTRFMNHVLVRHGNTNPVSPMWSLWIFFLYIVDQILCDSTVIFSWSVFEHEAFNLFVSISDHSGRLVWWLLQNIAEALLISYFFWRCLRTLHNQDHRS